MRTNTIEAVGIDDGGSLWVKLGAVALSLIYREAMEVHWMRNAFASTVQATRMVVGRLVQASQRR
jgi:hypothetical protein